jgi:hypothetical protein
LVNKQPTKIRLEKLRENPSIYKISGNLPLSKRYSWAVFDLPELTKLQEFGASVAFGYGRSDENCGRPGPYEFQTPG